VSHHGGTWDYLAPELKMDRRKSSMTPERRNSTTKKAKFTKKADVFAAGIVFLEIVTLKGSKRLYTDTWPLIEASTECPDSLRLCLANSLDADPTKRTTFTDLIGILKVGKEDIFAISESFYFSSKRLSCISVTKFDRERRKTLDDNERKKEEPKSLDIERQWINHIQKQRRKTLDNASLNMFTRRVSIEPGDHLAKVSETMPDVKEWEVSTSLEK
jgi:hypothetical protein